MLGTAGLTMPNVGTPLPVSTASSTLACPPARPRDARTPARLARGPHVVEGTGAVTQVEAGTQAAGEVVLRVGDRLG